MSRRAAHQPCNRSWARIVGLTALALLAVGCSKPTAADFKAEDTTASLERYFGHIVRAARTGNTDKAADYIKALMPSTSDIRSAFKKSAEEDAISKLHGGLTNLMSVSDAALVASFAPDKARSEIRAYRATVEEIIQNARDSVVFAEFPGGTRRIAERYLRKDLAFYEVEVTEPGKDSGSKFHLFWVSDGRWKTLGPAWRILTKKRKRR